MGLMSKEHSGPIQRWTATWAKRLLRRLLRDPEYRQRAVKRGVSLLLNGKLEEGGRTDADRNAAKFLGACSKKLPAHLRDFVEAKAPYEAWLAVNTWRPKAECALRSSLSAFEGRLPKVSFLTPVYNTDPGMLAAMVASVRAQVHEDWELCLVDDASTSTSVWPQLQAMAAVDRRILIARLDLNGGISAATNAAADLATGEILAFLDHDDLITSDCAAELALRYAADPHVDLVYSDDDKIGADGRRFAPQFKPDWSPTLLLSHMYIGHIFSVRRRLFLELGGFRSEFDGAQDYDFALRASRRAAGIEHIPKVLYHWRVTAGSTALSGEAKPRSLEAGRAALEIHAVDLPGKPQAILPAWAKALGSGYFQLEAPPEAKSDVALIFDGPAPRSKVDFAEVVLTRPDCQLAARLNEAAGKANSEFMLFLDGECTPPDRAALESLVINLKASGAAAVGPKQIDRGGRVLSVGITLDHARRCPIPLLQGADSVDLGPRAVLKTPRDCGFLDWNGLLIRRSAFESVGGFDNEAFPRSLHGEDLTARLRAKGQNVAVCPTVTIMESRPRPMPSASETHRFVERHGDLADPYYNPNLSTTPPHFAPWPYCPPDTLGVSRIGVFSHNLQQEGAPNTLVDLIIALKRTGQFDAIVFAPSDGPLRIAYESAGIPVEIIRQPPYDCTPVRHTEFITDLSKRLVEYGCDLVLANTLMCYYGILAAVEAGLGSVWWQHESEPWNQYFDFLDFSLRPFAYAAFGAAYRVVYVADSTLAVWRPVETRQNFMVIPHGVPAERQAVERDLWRREEARANLSIMDDEVVVLLIGTICARKGQRDLVAALQGLPETCRKSVRIFIVGATGEVDYGRALHTDRAGLPDGLKDRVTITGSVDDIAIYYRAADIFVCTSKLESAPRVIIEAMNFGLAIITTPVNGISQLVESNRSALFYPPGDVGELAKRLEQLISSPDLLASLASGSTERLAVLPGFDKMATTFESILRQAQLAGGTTARPSGAFGS